MKYGSDIIRYQYAGNPLHQTVDQYLTVDCDRESRHRRTNLKHMVLFHTYMLSVQVIILTYEAISNALYMWPTKTNSE